MTDEVLLVKKESLESVADAIREKSGNSEQLEFPEGFVETITSINEEWSWIKNDGKHYLHISLPPLMLSLPLLFNQSVEHGVRVDWGDGSPLETFEGNQVETIHTYSSSGNYIIIIDVISGTIEYGKPSDSWKLSLLGQIPSQGISYCHYIQKIEIGNNMKDNTVTVRGLQGMTNLTYVWVGDSITTIPNYFLYGSPNVSHLRLSSNITACFLDSNIAINELDLSQNELNGGTFTNFTCATSIIFKCKEPASDKSIWNFFNANSPNIREIHILNFTPPWIRASSICGGIKGDYTIYVPKGSKTAYDEATNWSAVASHIVEE